MSAGALHMGFRASETSMVTRFPFLNSQPVSVYKDELIYQKFTSIWDRLCVEVCRDFMH